ncbi:MAG: hypothetical protein FVQ80_03840 [Planctomycetes bacterium]|nr:hypothetical protein [Planctomycetota bacterium]
MKTLHSICLLAKLVIAVVIFCLGSVLIASQISKFDLAKLPDRAEVIALAKVTKIEKKELDSRRPTPYDEVTIKIASVLKGKVSRDHISLVLQSRGVKGFDPALNVGDTGVFFLRELNGSKAKLAYWGSIAVFQKPYFDLFESSFVLLEEEEQEDEGEEELEWSFDSEKIGSVPEGWIIGETAGMGKTAKWEVIRDDSAPSKDKAVAVTRSENYGETFNLLLAKKTNYKDVEVSVKVKAISGKEDRGGGPIWRAKDADNYYISRWNPLENNLRVYYVKDGRRVQLATADIKTDPGKWHEIEIEHVGNKIVAEFDDEKVIEIEDSTFAEGGMVGLWTKADAATAFDDFEVETEADDND